MIEPIEAGIAALITQPAQPRGVSRIAGQHGAALAGGHLLIGIEAEDGQIAEAADATPVEVRADGLAGVFDRDRRWRRAISEGVHLRWDAEGVNDEEAACAPGDCRSRAGVEIQRDRIDLREDRRSAHLYNGIGDRNKRKRRNDHLIARANAQRQQRQMQPGVPELTATACGTP